jgi:hypothetical protein
MSKRWPKRWQWTGSRALAAVFAGAGMGASAATLTTDETRWLQAAAPVRAYAQEQGLPLDIVVQPQETAGLAPLALAYIDGRCKLVLSMRGNPAVQEALDGLDDAFAGLAIETMAAHELGHCWRYRQGDWHVWPSGFSMPAADGSAPADWAGMAATRREEGFADLVALAYVQQRRPADYRAVQRWLTGVRADQPVEGAHHDTRAWVKLAEDPTVWSGPRGNLFERAAVLWRSGLAAPPQ